MIEYDTNAAVRGQRRGHLKGVRRQLTHMASSVYATSTALGSSNSILGPTPAKQTAIPELVHQ